MARLSLRLLVLTVLMTFAETAQCGQLRLMRYPDIGHGKVVFSYQGDLWAVSQDGGGALRLTVHQGYETHPKISPDGKWIAFTADYFGARNVFIIPVEGGPPKQLTYHPSPATVVGW